MLRREGLSYSAVRASLLESYGYAPSKSSLSEGFGGIHHPLGAANRFIAAPTPELAYVVGVELGDGSINLKGYNRRIRLQSVDREFVTEFDRCVSALLHSQKHSLWADNKRREVHVEAGSVLLYNFPIQPLDGLRVWIEHCDKCAAAFLKGFFDSEGSVEPSGKVTASNTDLALLDYAKKTLLRFFGMRTRGHTWGLRRGRF